MWVGLSDPSCQIVKAYATSRAAQRLAGLSLESLECQVSRPFQCELGAQPRGVGWGQMPRLLNLGSIELPIRLNSSRRIGAAAYWSEIGLAIMICSRASRRRSGP